MFTRTETSDWLGTIDYGADESSYGFLQNGYSASGVLSGSGDVDLIKVPMANGQVYDFVITGSDVTAVMLDDFGDVPFVSGELSFTPAHPSEHFYIQVSGTGSYTVTLAGTPADYAPDEEDQSGVLSSADLAIGETRTGVINGNQDVAELDYYRTTLIAGQTYRWTMDPETSVYGATAGGWLNLFGADGEQITSGFSYSASAWAEGAWLEFTPTSSGTYFIEAQTYGFNESGSYSINLENTSTTPTGEEVSITNTTLTQNSNGSWTLTVDLDLSGAIPALDVNGAVQLMVADEGYSRSGEVMSQAFSITAGLTSVSVDIELGAGSDYAGRSGIVVSVTDLFNAGVSTSDGFDYIALPDIAPEDLTIRGTNRRDNLEGGLGNDTISGRDGNDTIHGYAGRDTLRGNADNDRMFGDEGNDRLFGGGGRDNLRGGGNNDFLSGDGGRDTLTGGRGHDRFNFKRGDGNDTITDFDIDQDFIKIGRGANDFADLTFETSGSDVVVSFANVEITVENIAIGDLQNADLFIL